MFLLWQISYGFLYKALLPRRFASQLALLDLPLATLTVGGRAARPRQVGITAPLHRGSTAHGQQGLLNCAAQIAADKPSMNTSFFY